MAHGGVAVAALLVVLHVVSATAASHVVAATALHVVAAHVVAPTASILATSVHTSAAAATHVAATAAHVVVSAATVVATATAHVAAAAAHVAIALPAVALVAVHLHVLHPIAIALSIAILGDVDLQVGSHVTRVELPMPDPPGVLCQGHKDFVRVDLCRNLSLDNAAVQDECVVDQGNELFHGVDPIELRAEVAAEVLSKVEGDELRVDPVSVRIRAVVQE
mmetsp:Transcript_68886/g.161433  ORF Transcript_68886/g.161433 Transcript_68886/m.161433 type:complete len:221 (+) Transcript_68886:98-760(+)